MEIKVICGALIVKGDKFVIVQEAKEYVRGKWNIPAGHLEADENILDATRREIKEETDLDIAIDGFIGVFQHKSSLGNNIVGFWFKASVVNGELKHNNDELLNAKWVSFDEFLNFDNKQIRFPQLKNIVENYQVKGAQDLSLLNISGL